MITISAGHHQGAVAIAPCWRSRVAPLESEWVVMKLVARAGAHNKTSAIGLKGRRRRSAGARMLGKFPCTATGGLRAQHSHTGPRMPRRRRVRNTSVARAHQWTSGSVSPACLRKIPKSQQKSPNQPWAVLSADRPSNHSVINLFFHALKQLI